MTSRRRGTMTARSACVQFVRSRRLCPSSHLDTMEYPGVRWSTPEYGGVRRSTMEYAGVRQSTCSAPVSVREMRTEMYSCAPTVCSRWRAALCCTTAGAILPRTARLWHTAQCETYIGVFLSPLPTAALRTCSIPPEAPQPVHYPPTARTVAFSIARGAAVCR